MSVFSDFQRMWVQKFPESSLSDAWEQDVRASLTRHRQKIVDLQKELEQETLYVEYLERLLSDVEKFRESGGDPQSLIEAATPTMAKKQTDNASTNDKQEDEDSNKIITPIVGTTSSSSTASGQQIPSENGTKHIKDGGGGGSKEPLVQLRSAKDDPLNKCITELSSSFRRCISESPEHRPKEILGGGGGGGGGGGVAPSPQRPLSHFVTVIEVKETKNESGTQAPKETEEKECSVEVEGGRKSTDPSEDEDMAEMDVPNEEESLTTTAKDNSNATDDEDPSLVENSAMVKSDGGSGGSVGAGAITASASAASHSSESNVMRLINKNNNLISGNSSNNSASFSDKSKPIIPSGIVAATSSSSASSQETKKKVPPRPPPKYIRRAAPVEPPIVPNGRKDTSAVASAGDTSPSSSLERNLKPSDFLRQKSSDSLDVKAAEKRSTIRDDLSKKIRSENIEELKKGQSPTSSLGKSTPPPQGLKQGTSPTGSLNKVLNRSTDSPTHSSQKENAGSKESLISAHGGITDRIKSYESISSLSSDSARPGSQTVLDNEPYYDSVPMENSDGDYVYIQAGGESVERRRKTGGGSNSSRDDISTAGSTLPMSAAHAAQAQRQSLSNQRNSSQLQSQFEPESPGRNSNYVNIDYFLSQNRDETRSSSIDSDGEGSGEQLPVLMRAISHDDPPGSNTPGSFRKMPTINSGIINESGETMGIVSAAALAGQRQNTIKHIVKSIITSETFYVECLNKMMQYMKAIRATLTTSQPVITEEEFQTMFYKIDDLHAVHTEFLTNLKQKLDNNETVDFCVGEIFKKLAAHIHLYGAFLHNYGRAIDTVKICGHNNTQFKEIVSNIILNSKNEQSLTLEDLLHKPVARVQKNALVLDDLINATPHTHPDYLPLKETQNTIRTFLSEFNIVQTKSDDKALRRLVKNSYIVELADNHRKLRHLFLFNDVIACCKYKEAGREKIECELKWFIPLKDIVVLSESAYDPKEANPFNILHLKTQASTVRDQIMMEEREKSRAGDKNKKKLAELEAQLLLASPNLVFRINNKSSNKTMTFFLSSEYERTQWVDSIISLQQSCNLPGLTPLHDLQQYIAACQTQIKAEMGSFLMRNSRDESLLVGDLHFTIQSLVGVDHPADLFICVEIDSYGNYFRKAKTKLICRSANPIWNESFVLELEGSASMRILLYEDHSDRPVLKAKHTLKLSRTWLQEIPTAKMLRMNESMILNTMIKFVPGEVSLRRVPGKPGALFGAKMQQVLKREKREIPFIISACVREVERRGMGEVGIYRVSGSASDLARLKKSFETNPYEAEQLLKDVDIHSVTGILKSYLRELPEALFTDLHYPKFVDTFNKFSNFNEMSRIKALQEIFRDLPGQSQATINHILDHLIRVHHQESENKMSLHNLAMVFGPTLLRPAPSNGKQPKDGLESSTVDVMAQAGILYCFLQARIK